MAKERLTRALSTNRLYAENDKTAVYVGYVKEEYLRLRRQGPFGSREVRPFIFGKLIPAEGKAKLSISIHFGLFHLIIFSIIFSIWTVWSIQAFLDPKAGPGFALLAFGFLVVCFSSFYRGLLKELDEVAAILSATITKK